MFPKVLALYVSIRNPLGKLTSYEKAFDYYDEMYMRIVMGGLRFDDSAYIIGRSLGGIASRYNLLPLTKCPDDLDHKYNDSQSWHKLEYTLRKFMDENAENRIEYRVMLDYPNKKKFGFPASNRPEYLRLNIRFFNSTELVIEHDLDLKNRRCTAEQPDTSDSWNENACVCNFRLTTIDKHIV
uniref:Uncharacterized protein n=1 Tax=Romanomermis culicivorax TaxID=13658 RepID=A0A915KLZ1_ROMCU